MPLTDPEIREALAVCKAAAEGPWDVALTNRLGLYMLLVPVDETEHVARRKDNARFIQHARAHYAEALQELLELRKRTAELETDPSVSRREK